MRKNPFGAGALCGCALVLLLSCFPGAPRAICAQERIYTIGYNSGADIHLLVRDRLRAVYRRAGLDVRFVPLPQKRSLHSADSGELDAEAGRVAGIERTYTNLVRVDEKIADLVCAAFARRDSGVAAYSDDLLDSLRVGHVHGVLWAEQKMAGRPSTTVGDYEGLVNILLHGRVDLILGSRYSVRSVLAGMGGQGRDVVLLEPLIRIVPMYHYVHRKNAHLIPLLEKAIRELREEMRWDGRGAADSP